MSYWKNFVGTERRARIILGKRAIRVRAIEVILYFVSFHVCFASYKCKMLAPPLECFQTYFWTVSSSHSSTFSHERSQYYSMWIQKSNQDNLASRWRRFKLRGRWGTRSFPLLGLSFCFRFRIMNPHFNPNDNTIQNLIFIMAKMPQMFLCYGHPGCLFVFCQPFRHPPSIYLAHTYLKSDVPTLYWC